MARHGELVDEALEDDWKLRHVDEMIRLGLYCCLDCTCSSCGYSKEVCPQALIIALRHTLKERNNVNTSMVQKDN